MVTNIVTLLLIGCNENSFNQWERDSSMFYVLIIAVLGINLFSQLAIARSYVGFFGGCYSMLNCSWIRWDKLIWSKTLTTNWVKTLSADKCKPRPRPWWGELYLHGFDITEQLGEISTATSLDVAIEATKEWERDRFIRGHSLIIHNSPS